jgi:hypothetical protein
MDPLYQCSSRQVVLAAVLATTVSVAIGAVAGWMAGFNSISDLILVAWSTMSIVLGAGFCFALRKVPAPIKKSMAQKGVISSLAWVLISNAIVPMFLKVYFVCAMNPNPVYELAVVIGGFLLITSASAMFSFYGRRQRWHVFQDNGPATDEHRSPDHLDDGPSCGARG